MKRKICKVLLGGLLTVSLLNGVNQVVYASNVYAVTQEMIDALNASQSPESQAAMNEAYRFAQSTANGQAMSEIMLERDNLITAVRASIEANKNNPAVLTALNRALNAFVANYSTIGFTDAFQGVPLTAINHEADQAALAASLGTVGADLNATEQLVDETNRQLEAQRQAKIKFAKDNSNMLLHSAPAMPAVADGSPSTIYGKDSSGVYYYVDAGTWSDTFAGDTYSILNNERHCIAYLEIVVCENTYSLGILVHSTGDDVALGYNVDGLVTRKMPPYSS